MIAFRPAIRRQARPAVHGAPRYVPPPPPAPSGPGAPRSAPASPAIAQGRQPSPRSARAARLVASTHKATIAILKRAISPPTVAGRHYAAGTTSQGPAD